MSINHLCLIVSVFGIMKLNEPIKIQIKTFKFILEHNQ